MSHRDDVVDGRYRLLERIGSGGMGFVWRAADERLGREVAVKQLHLPRGPGEDESEVWHQRAMREARITARLHHPHAVAVFDVVENHGEPCLIMEYFPSRSLHEILRERGSLPPAELARIGSEVASALAAAHGVGIVHRDVKPGNILIAEDGTAKISDFGIAHAMGDVSLTSTGMVTGTPAYLAPEVARGADSSPASDVFSLGSTLYAALEGEPPFGSHENPMALLHRVASGTITPPAQAGPLTPLVLRMLAADPTDRPSMDEVARTLRKPLAGPAGAVGPTLVLPEAAATVPAPAPSQGPTAPTAALPVAGAEAADGGAAGAASPPVGPPAADLLMTAGQRRTEAESVPPEGHRRRNLLVGLALLLAVAGLALAVRSVQGDAQTPARAVQSSSASTGTTSAPQPSTTVPTTRPTTSTPPRPSPSEPTVTAPDGTPTAAQLAQAVEAYYALLPGDLDAGWAHLTERYQRSTAKDRKTYDAFWGSVDSVAVSNATGSAPGSATATITYRFSDGRVFVERTSYGLVEQDGVLKIDRSKVLSSQRR